MWSASDWNRFPGIPHCSIDTTGNDPAADVLDIETGAATVAQAPDWAKQHNAVPGAYPAILYCNRDNMPALTAAMAAAGLQLAHHYFLFVATLDGTKTLPGMTGVWGVQYAGSAQTGGHYDESLIYIDAWEPTAPTPVPPASTHPSAPAPPGLWRGAMLTGIGLDGRLWQTEYNAAKGSWTAPVRIS